MIQSRKYALDHAGYTAPTRQHELNRTDHTDHTDQESNCRPCLADLDNTDQEYCPERSR